MRNKGIPYIFRGPFKEYILKLIDYKRSLGFKVGSSVYYTLKGMDDFFLGYGLLSDSLILTKEMVEAYVARRGSESSKTQHTSGSLRIKLIKPG